MNNPYAPPATPGPWVQSAKQLPDDSFWALAKRTFIAWEKLRVVFVALLVVETVALIGPLLLFNPQIAFMVIHGAIVVNLFYFAGPIVEILIRRLGYQRPWPRWFMFLSGTALSMIATAIIIFDEILPLK